MGNKVALITGASGGIGSSIAYMFAKEGYNLALVYNKDEESIDNIIDSINKDIGLVSILKIQADLSKEEEINKVIDKFNAKFNRIDVLINNAGKSLVKFFDTTTNNEWDDIFNINVKSAFILSKMAVKKMISQKFGCIINISSIWGISGASMEVAYSASKSALIGMSKALSKEVGPSNIRVNVIAPGVIDTKMNSHLSKEEIDQLKEETPLNKLGSSKDIANMAVYLASDKGKFVTGQVIKIDGGFLS